MSVLKVYGVNLDGRHRGIVAAKNKTQAAKVLKVSMYHFNQYAGETGNTVELELAMREPGIVWTQAYAAGSEWLKLASS